MQARGAQKELMRLRRDQMADSLKVECWFPHLASWALALIAKHLDQVLVGGWVLHSVSWMGWQTDLSWMAQHWATLTETHLVSH